MKLKDIHEILNGDLQDPEYTSLYLNDALNQGSQEEFLLALRNVIRANQETFKVTEEMSLEKENLYKGLSEFGNPHFSTVYSATR